MFRNLLAEMARFNVSNADLMKTLDFKSEKTLNNKLTGRTDFTRKEMFLIKQKHFPDYDLEYLFQEFETTPNEISDTN
jgi:hypothetical protein